MEPAYPAITTIIRIEDTYSFKLVERLLKSRRWFATGCEGRDHRDFEFVFHPDTKGDAGLLTGIPYTVIATPQGRGL